MSENNNRGGGCCGSGPIAFIGTVLAVIMSWGTNHSILWAIIHGCLSWFYVIYHWVAY